MPSGHNGGEDRAGWALNRQRTRKITRVGILAREQVEQALAPILPLAPAQQLFEDDLEERIRKKLADIPRSAVNAFFSGAAAADVARMLGGIESSWAT